MIEITISTKGITLSGKEWEKVLPMFQKRAGELIISEIRAILGTDEIYQLNPEYAEIKPTLEGYKHISGKPAHQPLIFSGEMYEGLEATTDPFGADETLIVRVDPFRAVNERTGEDYAEKWEEATGYLEKGLGRARPKLVGILQDVVIEVFAGAIHR